MNIVIHRGTHEIGGSCVELATQNSRVLIDAGLPLNDTNTAKEKSAFPLTLAESLKRTSPPLSGIVISHPHMDHYGLVPGFPPDVPVYSGKVAAALMKLSIGISHKDETWSNSRMFSSGVRFNVGDFIITPYMMDHSGFDSYAFLIEANGRRIFYSGDFRDHGRKAQTVKRFLTNPPADIDVLLLEGTTVGQSRGEFTLSEEELESEFAKLINQTAGPVFVTLAGQNIDRVVTVFKAAKRTGRMFVIDPYIAEVLDQIRLQYETSGTECKIPHASWPQIKVCYLQNLCRWLKRNGREDILSRNLKYGVNWRFLSENQSKIVMIVRPSSPDEILKKGYFDLTKARWIYSMWQGYLETDKKLAAFDRDLRAKATAINYLHTSGHATVEALQALATALTPGKIIPIHTAHPEQFSELFSNVVTVNDGIAYPV